MLHVNVEPVVLPEVVVAPDVEVLPTPEQLRSVVAVHQATPFGVSQANASTVTVRPFYDEVKWHKFRCQCGREGVAKQSPRLYGFTCMGYEEPGDENKTSCGLFILNFFGEYRNLAQTVPQHMIRARVHERASEIQTILGERDGLEDPYPLAIIYPDVSDPPPMRNWDVTDSSVVEGF